MHRRPAASPATSSGRPLNVLLAGALALLAACGGGGSDPCKPATCPELGHDCGPASDGCGHILQCGDTCPGTQTCGGAGVPGVCGDAPCTPKSCGELGMDCGPVSDGCGRILQCGDTCPGTQTCGGAGVPGVCG
jgi:hypothetical protein